MNTGTLSIFIGDVKGCSLLHPAPEGKALVSDLYLFFGFKPYEAKSIVDKRETN